MAALRTFVNLWIVFLLCGLWHGASLTFIAWGLYHGLLLILERFAHTQWNWRPSGVFGIAASFILLMIGWVFFRSPTLAAAGHYLTAMALLGPQAGGITAALSGTDARCHVLSGARHFLCVCAARSSGALALRQTRGDGVAAYDCRA